MGELVKTYGLLLRADEAEILYELVEKDVNEHTMKPLLANKGVQLVRSQCNCTMCRIFKKMKVQFKGAIP